MTGTNKHTKNKLVSTLKLMVALVVLLVAVALYNTHKDAQRMEYAERNGCTWTTYGGHDICR